jgi:hypothetical protein
MRLALVWVLALLRYHSIASSTSRGGLVAHRRATEDERGRGAADSPLRKLDTYSASKVSYILIAVDMPMDTQIHFLGQSRRPPPSPPRLQGL